jgi:hypothetical protein
VAIRQDGTRILIGDAVACTTTEIMRTIDQEVLVDDVAHRLCRDLLIQNAQSEMAFPRLEVRVKSEAHDLELRFRNTVVGRLRATAATPIGGRQISGNFLTSGSHWSELELGIRVAIHQPLPSEAAGNDHRGHESAAWIASLERELCEYTVIDEVPDATGVALRGQILEASRRIREERSLAFERSVTLEWHQRLVTFATIRSITPAGLVVPIQWQGDETVVTAGIELRSIRDPVRLLIAPEVPASMLVEIWASILLGFAELTCPSEHGDRHGRDTSRPASGHRSPAVATETRGLPRYPSWPGNLLPIGSWAVHGAALVCGHVRRLPTGQASDEACARAAEVGIRLRQGETWVRPHARGAASDYDIRFRWTPPPSLSSPNFSG